VTKVKDRAIELSSGELTVEAAMEAELSGEDGNGDFVLTIARLELQPHRGGRGKTAKLVARWRQQWCGGAGTRRW